MIEILLFIFLLLGDFFALKTWTVCKNLSDEFFHFFSSRFNLELNGFIYQDKNIPIKLIRFFHNKPAAFIIGVFDRYLHFWDSLFLINLLSISGFFFLLYGLWNLAVTKKYKELVSLISFSIILSFLEIFLNLKINFVVKLILISIPYQILVVFGFWSFIRRHKSIKISMGVLFLSAISGLWILTFPHDVLKYCVR